MEASVHWKGNMIFEGSAGSGFVQKMDSGTAVGGQNSAGRPMEFIALGLAGCTAMDVVSVLQKKRQPVVDFQVTFQYGRAEEHPKVFTQAVIEYVVTGRGVEEAALYRAIELSVEKYCPAYAMLSKAFPMQLHYKILDEGTKDILVEGEYRHQG